MFKTQTLHMGLFYLRILFTTNKMQQLMKLMALRSTMIFQGAKIHQTVCIIQ